jgi:hypothetical protein
VNSLAELDAFVGAGVIDVPVNVTKYDRARFGKATINNVQGVGNEEDALL